MNCPCKTAECREDAMVVIRRNDEGKPVVWCDPCIAPIVRSLNDCGMATTWSCCGHGHRPGIIGLADGRQVMILPDLESSRQADAAFKVDIAGKIKGLHMGEELRTFEDFFAPRLAAAVCHSIRVAVLAESGERIFKIEPLREIGDAPEPSSIVREKVRPTAEDAFALLGAINANSSVDPREDARKALEILQRELEFANSRSRAHSMALSLCRADLEKARHDRVRYRTRIELLQADGGAAAMGRRRPPG